MNNPIVTIDLRNHPHYSLHKSYYAKIWKAEVLTLNCNTGNMRVRLLNDDGDVEVKNLDTSMSYIVDDKIIIDLTDY